MSAAAATTSRERCLPPGATSRQQSSGAAENVQPSGRALGTFSSVPGDICHRLHVVENAIEACGRGWRRRCSISSMAFIRRRNTMNLAREEPDDREHLEHADGRENPEQHVRRCQVHSHEPLPAASPYAIGADILRFQTA